MDKLINYLNQNPDIFNVVFWKEDDTKDFSIWFEDQNEESLKAIKETEWLYLGGDPSCPVGIYRNKYVIGINNDGQLFVYCIGLQNLPYKLIELAACDSGYGKDEIIQGINKFTGKDYYKLLKEYEGWCSNNNLPIEINNDDWAIEEEFWNEVNK